MVGYQQYALREDPVQPAVHPKRLQCLAQERFQDTPAKSFAVLDSFTLSA